MAPVGDGPASVREAVVLLVRLPHSLLQVLRLQILFLARILPQLWLPWAGEGVFLWFYTV